MPPKLPEPEQRMNTRDGNVLKRPGLALGVKQTRRTPAEMKEFRASQAQEKAEKMAKKTVNVANVAALESKARHKISQTNLHRDHPSDNLNIPRVTRVRSTVSEPELDPKNNTKCNDGMYLEAPDDTEDLDGSVSNFQPEDENEVDVYDMDVDPDDNNTMQKKMPGAKRPKKGVVAREEVNRAAGIETSSPLAAITPEVNKRKAEGPRQGTLKKSKTQPGGLFPNWEKTHHSHPQLPHRHNANSSSGYSGISDFENDANESKSSPAFEYGGILSENEEVEWLASKESRTISRHQVVTKIEPIHRVPYTNISRQLSKKKTKKYNHSDLPRQTLRLFTSFIIPKACKLAGAQDPWTNIEDADVAKIWNEIFHDEFPITNTDEDDALWPVVKSLVRYGVSNWVHKFAKTAVTALEDELERQELRTSEEKARVIQQLLGDIDHMESKRRPFLWSSKYDFPDTPQEGIFQGHLVSRTFVEHLIFIDTIPHEMRLDARPTGALMYAIQAVHQALLYSITGTYNCPDSRVESAFLHQNWGDYYKDTIDQVSGHHKKVLVKRGTLFKSAINRMHEPQWDDIIQSGWDMKPKDKLQVKKESIVVEDGTEDSEDDDELINPRYNPLGS